MDNKNFQSFITNSNVLSNESNLNYSSSSAMRTLKKNNSYYSQYLTTPNKKKEQNTSLSIQSNRTARTLNPITHSCFPTVDVDTRLMTASKKLYKNQLDTNGFLTELKNQGVNTESDAIKSVVNSHVNGAPRSFSSLIKTINSHRNDTNLTKKEDKRYYAKGTTNLTAETNSNYTANCLVMHPNNDTLKKP